MVRLLARLGANPNALRASHSNSSPLLSPLQLACGAETDVPANEEVLTLLLQAGAAPNGTVKCVVHLFQLSSSSFACVNANQAASIHHITPHTHKYQHKFTQTNKT